MATIGNENGSGNEGKLQQTNGTKGAQISSTSFEGAADTGPQEDQEIFSFFKRYIALLTAVGSLPVISAGIDVLAPPSEAKKLSVISSLSCVIVLGICVLFKGTFAAWCTSRNLAKKVSPALLAGAFLILAIFLAAQNSNPKGNLFLVSNFSPEMAYLLIFPCLVAALGVTLMASYSQFHGFGIRLEAKIDEKILDKEMNKRVKSMAEHYISILTASTEETIGRFSDSILRRFDSSINNLAAGFVESSGARIEEMQKVVLEHFKRSVYCVSDRDLKFWQNGFCDHITSADELIAKEYLRLNIDAVSNNTKVTRIFIFDDSDFNYNEVGIVSILAKHHEAGIGWAVLLHEELPSHLKTAQQSLDFALLDKGSAVGILSNYNMDQQRRLYILLDVPSPHRARIKEYDNLHRALISQCWVASEDFCKIHELSNTVDLDQAIAGNRDKANALNFGSGKVIKVDAQAQIANSIGFIRSLRRKNMLYWGEVRSQNVIDLEGDWIYTVKGTEIDGTKFEHRGTCRGLIEEGRAYFAGTRLATKRMGPDKLAQETIHDARWKSSAIHFSDDGKMEYSSTISVDGSETRGLGEISFSHDRKSITGVIHMILGRGKVVSADVEFHRPKGVMPLAPSRCNCLDVPTPAVQVEKSLSS